MARYFTDFRKQTTDQAPTGWTIRWETGNQDWTVREKAGTVGGKCLEHTATVTDNRLLSLDAAGTPADAEIVARLRTSELGDAGNRQNGLALRGSGEGGINATGYRASLLRDGAGTRALWLERRLPGMDTIGTYAFEWAADTWYWVRFRAQGTSLKVRIWADGQAEPSAWHIEVTDANLASGWVGVTANTATGTRDWDVVGVGTGGDTAPAEGLTLSNIAPADASNWGAESVAFAATYSHYNAAAGTIQVEADTVDTFNSANLKTGSVNVSHGQRGTVNLTLAARGTWYWRIRAVSGDDDTLWVTRTVIRTAASVHLVSPTTAANVVTAPQEFRLIARADEAATVKVEWQTDKVDTFNSGDLVERETALAASGQEHLVEQHYLGADTWYWRARAVRNDEVASDWTSPLTLAVNTGGALPSSILPNPANTVYLDPLTMTIVWSASLAHVLTPTADPSLRLEVQMDMVEGFPDPESEISVRVHGGQRTIVNFPMSTGGLIWFRFRTLADYGADSAWVTHLVAVALTVQFSAPIVWEKQMGPKPNRVYCRIAGGSTVKTASVPDVPAAERIDHWIEVPSGTSEAQAQAAADAALATLQARPLRVEGDVPLTVLATFDRLLRCQWWEWEPPTVTGTFARASIRYHPDTGAEIATGVPAYRTGKYAEGLMLEEGVANRCTENQSSPQTVTGFTGKDAAIDIIATHAWHGASSLRCIPTSTGVDCGAHLADRLAVSAGSAYAWQARGIHLAGGTVELRCRMDWFDAATGGTLLSTTEGTARTLNANWLELSVWDIAPAGATHVAPRLWTLNSVTSAEQWAVDGLQFEDRGFPTSWHLGNGARAAESAYWTLPAVLPQEFALHLWFKPDWPSTVSRTLVFALANLTQATPSADDRVMVYFEPADDTLRVLKVIGGVPSTLSSVALSFAADTWIGVVIRQTATGMHLSYRIGANSVVHVSNDNTAAFATNLVRLYLGHFVAGREPNATLDAAWLKSGSLSDEEAAAYLNAASAPTLDSGTQFLYQADGTLVAELGQNPVPVLRETADLVLAKKVHHISAGVATTRIYAGDYAQPAAEAVAAALAKALRG